VIVGTTFQGPSNKTFKKDLLSRLKSLNDNKMQRSNRYDIPHSKSPKNDKRGCKNWFKKRMDFVQGFSWSNVHSKKLK